MKQFNFVGILLIVVLLLVAIGNISGFHVPYHRELYEYGRGHICGFWGGLWHGIISPITFVVGWFNHSVDVWEVNNNGGWYTFGFLLGVGGFLKGSSSSSKS